MHLYTYGLEKYFKFHKLLPSLSGRTLVSNYAHNLTGIHLIGKASYTLKAIITTKETRTEDHQYGKIS